MSTAAERVNEAENHIQVMMMLRRGLSPDAVVDRELNQLQREVAQDVHSAATEIFARQGELEQIVTEGLEGAINVEPTEALRVGIQQLDVRHTELKEINEDLIEQIGTINEEIDKALEAGERIRRNLQIWTQLEKEAVNPVAKEICKYGAEVVRRRSEWRS